MDRLDCMRLYLRVIERCSFTAAAADLGVSRSAATEAIKELEARLGARLLQRTTRHVSPTPDGEAFYARVVAILGDIDDAESAFATAQPQGRLRIDAPGLMARRFLLPKLPDFMASYPRIDLHIGSGERYVDLVREGVDCVLRSGETNDSGMMSRKIARLREVTCASPAYLARHGTPRSPDDLGNHVAIGFVSSRTQAVIPLEFTIAGVLRHVSLPCRLTTNDADTTAELARLGFGLIQAPRYRFEEDFRRGTLVEILQDTPPSPTTVYALYPQNRQLASRVRVFLDWVVGVFADSELA